MAHRRDRIPGINPDAERNINQMTGSLDERLRKLERSKGRAGVVLSDTNAIPGEFLNIEAPAAGLTVILPEPVPSLLDARVTLCFRNKNPVRLVAIRGLVNGFAFVRNTAVGTFEAVCDGLTGWSVETGLSPAGSSIDAEYVLGAAHVGIPNGRVATDSTEIDAILTTPLLISWALRTASVVFAKLQDLTGLSVLGRAATTTGVMAAITATVGGQYLRANVGLTSLEWADPASASVINTGGQFQRAAMTGAIACAQNSNTTVFSGILSNGGTTNDRGQLDFRNTTSNIWNLVDNAVGNSIEINCERAAVTGSVSAAQNSNLFRFSGIRTNGALQTPRQFLNFIDTATILWIPADDAGADEWEERAGVNLAADYAWTGSHTFTGLNFIVDVSGTAQLMSVADLTVASTTGGLWLSAGHTPVVSPSVSNGDVLINAGNGAGLFAKATAVTNVAAGEVQLEADGDVRINGIGGTAVSASATLPAAPTVGSLNLEADGQVRVFTNGVERLEIESSGAWQVGGAVGAAGQVLTSAGAGAPPAWAAPQGRLIRVQTFTASGTFTWTTTASGPGRFAIIEMIGGGGGGAGAAATAAANTSVGSGGGCGFWRKALWTKAAGATLTVTVGAGATASAAGAAGNNGGATTVTDGTTSVTCAGGQGGNVMASGSTPAMVAGGIAGSSSAITGPSAVDIYNPSGGGMGSSAGQIGLRLAAAQAHPGVGGFSLFTGGNNGNSLVNTTLTGSSAGSPGAGGSGSANVNGALAAKAGSPGSPALVVVYEYT